MEKSSLGVGCTRPFWRGRTAQLQQSATVVICLFIYAAWHSLRFRLMEIERRLPQGDATTGREVNQGTGSKK